MPRIVRATGALLIALSCAGLARPAEPKAPPRVYAPRPGEPADVNGDGISDVDAILNKIDELASVGVRFDDEDRDGNVPARREDGLYHMACVDLINVVYRAAGYDMPSAQSGGPLLGQGIDPKKLGHGTFRSIDCVVPWLKRNPNFHYYRTPEINLVANRRWRPAVPFRIGDMVFVHYDDASDRHSGIVTGVDPATGLPTHITNCSIYNENQGLHRATVDEFFALKCRMLSGYCRPAAWDGEPVVDPVELRTLEPEVFAAKKPGGHPGSNAARRAANAIPVRRRAPRGRRASAGLAAPLGGALAATGAR